MKPRRGPLSPALRRWAEQASPTDRRDVLVRLAFGTDPARAANRLTELGGHVQQQAQTTVVLTATGSTVLAAAGERWVTAIEEPHPLQPR